MNSSPISGITRNLAYKYYAAGMSYIEVVCSDRIGKRVHVKCLPEDLVGEFKQVLALQMKTRSDRIVLKRGNAALKDHISLADYEIKNKTMLELFYQ